MHTQRTALIQSVVDMADNLKPNEAIFLPTECVVARSSTGKLRFGDGTQAPTWRKGDAAAMLRDHLAAMLDPRELGHFAGQYRRELANVKPIAVENVGRRDFRIDYQPTDAAIGALMLLQDCEWFEYEGRPYGAAEAWTREGRHLWVTPTGEIRDLAT